MRINLLNSFASGMLLTTAVCSIVYFSSNGQVTKTPVKTPAAPKTVKVQPSDEEMKSKLTAAGYVVQTKSEYDNKLKAAAAQVQKKADTATSQSKQTVNRVVINVTDGMTSINVGRMLEKAGIIKGAFNFSKDIEKRKLENKLKPGIYVVDSKMTYEQVIAAIFK